jgi:hypothetical protein
MYGKPAMTCMFQKPSAHHIFECYTWCGYRVTSKGKTCMVMETTIQLSLIHVCKLLTTK